MRVDLGNDQAARFIDGPIGGTFNFREATVPRKVS
jgi:hypothetical protein